jgi:UDP-glucose:(heptosyl)LPS alpha-1,3-glucosyltransferase
VNIAFVTPAVNKRTGTNMFLAELIEHLVDNHNVTIVSTELSDLDCFGKLTFYRVPDLPKWVPNLIRYLWFLLISDFLLHLHQIKKFDIIHSTGGDCFHANIITSHFCQHERLVLTRKGRIRLDSPTFFHKIHTWVYMQVVSAIEKKQYTSIGLKKVIAVSRGLRDELIRHYGCPPSKIVCIPNGVDIDKFSSSKQMRYRGAIRERLGFHEKDFILIFVGGDWGRKGLNLVLHAIANLPDSRVSLLVAGNDRSEASYRQLSHRLGIEQQIHFLGHCTDVVPYLASSDAFIMPSSYEAFSVAMLEASAMGLPLIVTKINGAEELVKDGINGFFVKHNSRHIADVISVLSKDKKLLRRLSLMARQVVEQEYTWDSIVERTLEVYDGLAQSLRSEDVS